VGANKIHAVHIARHQAASGNHKRNALDKISDLKLSKTVFKDVPGNMDAILHNSANIWFSEEKNLEVTVPLFRVTMAGGVIRKNRHLFANNVFELR
jgi:hypothetical protein